MNNTKKTSIISKDGVSYLIPESVYGKVELEPYFKMDYSYATVEFKIGMEQKYV